MQPAIFASPYRAGSFVVSFSPAPGYDIGPITQIDQNLILFSRQPSGVQASKIVNLWNRGSRPVDFNSISGNTAIGVSASTGEIAPGESIEVTVTWTPGSAGLFVDETIVFNCTEGATPHNYSMKVMAASIDSGGLTTSNYGGGGTLTVSADDTKYVLTADVDYVVFSANVTNSVVDLAGFDVTYANGAALHGVTITSNGVQHCLIDDSVGTGEIVQFDGNQDEINSIHIDAASIKAFEVSPNVNTRPKGRTCVSFRQTDNGGAQGLIIGGNHISECPAVGPENYVHVDTPNRGGLWSIIKIGRAGAGSDTWYQVRNAAISGGAQGGITAEQFSNYGQIYNCTIDHTETTENGAGIQGGDFLEAWGNNIGSGTCYGDGIGIGGSFCLIFDNTISVRRNPGHVGYWATDHIAPDPPFNGGPEVYGIQMDPDNTDDASGPTTVDTYMWGNDVTVTAYNGSGGDDPNIWGGFALRMTAIRTISTVRIFDNTFRAVREVGSTISDVTLAAFSLSDSGGYILSHNTVVTDGDFVSCDFDGIRANAIVQHTTLQDGPNPSGTGLFMRIENGGSNPISLQINDTDVSGSSLTHDNTTLSTASTGASDISIGYTQTITTNAPGASASIDDAQSNTVSSGAFTGFSYEALLNYTQWVGATAGTAPEVTATPHLVDVTAAGYNDSLDNAVTSNTEKTTNIILTAV